MADPGFSKPPTWRLERLLGDRVGHKGSGPAELRGPYGQRQGSKTGVYRSKQGFSKTQGAYGTIRKNQPGPVPLTFHRLGCIWIPAAKRKGHSPHRAGLLHASPRLRTLAFTRRDMTRQTEELLEALISFQRKKGASSRKRCSVVSCPSSPVH
jgi:hypothetical protein